MLKSSKGITLVALVITIIVLLILAGVTLKIVLDDNLIGNSRTAVNAYSEKADNETAIINYLSEQVQIYKDQIATM